MKFSEYLRKLDEGNLGHELEKQEKAKKEAEDNTVKEPSGETMLDPQTGKPFPKKGPLKDWQVPALKEDTQIEKDEEVPGKGTVRAKDKKTGKTSTTEVNMRGSEVENQHGETASEHRAGQSKSDQNFDDLRHPIGDSRRRGGARANPTPARGSFSNLHKDAAARDAAKKIGKKEVVNDSLEIPTRDALGRLSIYSMNEASQSALRRRLASSNVPHAEKQRAQANLNIKDKDSARRAEATAGDPETPLDVAVRAGDAMGKKPTPPPQKQRVLTPADKANANTNAPKWIKKKTEEHEQEQALGREADRRADARGMTDRQSHLDEPR